MHKKVHSQHWNSAPRLSLISVASTRCYTVNPTELYAETSDGEPTDELEAEEHLSFRRAAKEIRLKCMPQITALHSNQASLTKSWTPPTPPSSQETISSSQESALNGDVSVRPTLPLATRKRIFLYDTPPETVVSMRQWSNSLLSKHLGSKDPQKCWLHPDPMRSMCNHSGIRRMFKFRHAGEWQPLYSIQFGVTTLLLSGRITEQQRRGMIEESWHLSHLCGNWTCLNSAHFTIEPGRINVGRNRCFRRNGACQHQPRCLAALKLPVASLVPRKP